MKLVSTSVAATMLASGVAKLNSVPAYERLVDGRNWSHRERHGIGVAEAVGGLMMLLRPTRSLGAGVVLAASGVALAAEFRSGRDDLATVRAGVMAAALLVCITG